MFPRFIVENIMPLIRFNPVTGLFLAMNNNPIYIIMLRKFNFSAIILAFALWLTACVPARQFDDLKKKHDTCEAENAKLKADIADLRLANPVLRVEGEAPGPTADALRFIAESPVAGWIDHGDLG